MATRGQYVGETVLGSIAENVNLGQVIYCKTEEPPISGFTKGAWYIASADIVNNPYGAHQLGIALETATASTISSTQSGTEIPILLKGYYSPGDITNGGYCDGNLAEGHAIYLMPSSIADGAVSGLNPIELGATQSILRIVGYAYDVADPYILRFEPDKSWMEISNSDTEIKLNGIDISPSGNLQQTLALGNTTGTYSILANTGTGSLPSYSFSSSPNTGMYIPETNKLGFSVNGATNLIVDSNRITIPTGSIVNPSLVFSGENSTGISRPGPSLIGVSIAGATAALFNSSGIVLPITNSFLSTNSSGQIVSTSSIAGSSGSSGSSGTSGSSGINGTIGSNGVSGSAGSSGTSGSSGSSGVEGLIGADAPLTFIYAWGGTGSFSDPGTGYYNTDSSNIAFITKISISKITEFSTTGWFSSMYSSFSLGQTVYIQITGRTGFDDARIVGMYQITNMINQTLHWDISVSFLSGSGTLPFLVFQSAIVWGVNGGLGTSGSSGTSGVNGSAGSSGSSGTSGSSTSISYASIYSVSTGAATSANNTWTKINSTTTVENISGLTASSGRITNNSGSSKTFLVNTSTTGVVSSLSSVIRYAVSVNAATPSSYIIFNPGTNSASALSYVNISTTSIVTLNNNEYVEPYFYVVGSSATYTCRTLQMTATTLN